jgi:hypothetical protein
VVLVESFIGVFGNSQNKFLDCWRPFFRSDKVKHLGDEDNDEAAEENRILDGGAEGKEQSPLGRPNFFLLVIAAVDLVLHVYG